MAGLDPATHDTAAQTRRVAADARLEAGHDELEETARLRCCLPYPTGTILPGCGHWTQQERAAEVNAAMIDFLGSLPSMW